MKLRTLDGSGEPPAMFTRDAAGAGEAAGVAAAAAAALAVLAFDVFGSGSRMRTTLRAVSSASSSAGSLGFDTLAGSRAALESWIDGGVKMLMDDGAGAVRSATGPANERATRV